VIFSLGMMAMMTMSALAVRNGTQTVGDFVFVNVLLMQLSAPLAVVGFIYSEVRQGLANIEQMFDLLDTDAEVTDAPDARNLVVGSAAISFRDVHFAYDPKRPILKGISFDIPAGHTVAVVGPSGAGKSTLSRLLYRFYDIQEGSITIDGQDVRNVTQKSLRSAIGMVPQDTVLFNETIAYNIGYGRPGATEEEIEAAARIAQVDRFIRNLPDGYKSMVGERGLKPQVAADPDPRRGDLGARHPHRARNPGGTRRRLQEPQHPRYCSSAIHGGRCRRDHRAQGRHHRRTRPPWRVARPGRPLCPDVEPPAGSDRSRGTSGRSSGPAGGGSARLMRGFAAPCILVQAYELAAKIDVY
jgi:ATP-binding cassette subfamily B protein